MLCDSVAQQNHINVVVKVLFLLTRWFLSFQFAGQQKREYVPSVRLFAQEAVMLTDNRMFNTRKCMSQLALTWNRQASMYHK